MGQGAIGKPNAETAERTMHAVIDAGRVRVGAIEIDALSFAQAIDRIEDLVNKGEGGIVFTPNVDHVVLAEEDARMREAYSTASLSLVDGVPVLWAARLLGTPLPEKISGSDLFLPLLARAADRRWRVYFLGGQPGVAERAKQILEEQYPNLAVVGTSAPKIDLAKSISEQRDIIDPIALARPELLFLALGAPKQEIWGSRIRELVHPAVILGIGASLDFVAGAARRAPRWMSKVGLEWSYRFAQEPRRMAERYLLRDPKFLAIVARQMLRR